MKTIRETPRIQSARARCECGFVVESNVPGDVRVAADQHAATTGHSLFVYEDVVTCVRAVA